MSNQATNVTRVANAMLPVSDQDRAVDFYVEKLGFEKRVDLPFTPDGDRWIEVGPPGAETTVALVPPRGDDSVGIQSRIAFATTDIEADHAKLREQGVDVDAEVMRMEGPVPPMFFFRDQDGNTLLIVELS